MDVLPDSFRLRNLEKSEVTAYPALQPGFSGANMNDISEAAAALGRKGGNANTEAQKKARSENGKKATGRPKGSKNKPKEKLCES